MRGSFAIGDGNVRGNQTADTDTDITTIANAVRERVAPACRSGPFFDSVNNYLNTVNWALSWSS